MLQTQAASVHLARRALMTLAFLFVAPCIQAQDTETKWGAEGRIGASQAGYLIRWLSADWSLLVGGTYSVTSTDNENNSTGTDASTANVNASLRHDWGTGRVRPFFGIGPVFTYSRATFTSSFVGSPGSGESRSTSTGAGGRAELGAYVPITQSVALGLLGGVVVTRNSAKIKPSGSAAELKSASTQVTVGNLQFLVRVRF